MTLEQVEKLHHGDEVFWNDPDNGLCSKHVIILEIKIHDQLASDGDDVAVTLVGYDGDTLQCFASELT